MRDADWKSLAVQVARQRDRERRRIRQALEELGHAKENRPPEELYALILRAIERLRE